MKAAKVILITGASSGFGRISAQMLAEHGHIVYGTSRKASPSVGKVMMLEMDITNNRSIKKGIEQIIAEQNHIDVLINNAGMGISGALELATEEEVRQQIDTNFFGMINMCQAVLPFMRTARQGRIINISSIAGVIAVPFQGLYSASKFAVEGYSEALDLELYPFNIKVCLVEPGDFNTGFTSNRNISPITLEHPDYKKYFSKAMEIIEACELEGEDPRKLGIAICKLVEKPSPPFRTFIGPAEQVFFARCRNLIPARLKKYLLRLTYGIKGSN